MKPLVVFDCWGTLFYSRRVYIETIARELGTDRNDPEFIARFEGGLMRAPQTDQDLLRSMTDLAVSYGHDAATAARCLRHLKTGLTQPTAYDETIAVLRQLHADYQLVLLTNTVQVSFERLRRQFDLDDLFDALVTSFDTGILKPDPQMFHFVLKKMGVSADRAVMVGDSLTADYNGARAVGMRAVLVDRTNRHPAITDRITDLLTLPDWLARDVT